MQTRPRALPARSQVFNGPGLTILLGALLGGQIALAAQVAGPLTASRNPNFFKDANGVVLILNGSQTWNTLQDWGSNGSVENLDFDAYVKFLTAHGLDFTLLWRTEMPRFCGLPLVEGSAPDMTVTPHPWPRTGPGKATDGGLKFDLTKFDQRFFDRLRSRAQALNSAGIFVGVSPSNAICREPDMRWENFRDNLGYILRYSRRVNLANVIPRSSLSSTGYCLAQTPPIGAEYLAYAPSGGSFTMDLSAMSPSRTLAVEWFNPSTGATIVGEPIPAGSPSQSFTPPFSQDAVLYLVDTTGHAASGRH